MSIDTSRFYASGDAPPDALPGAVFASWSLRTLSRSEFSALSPSEWLAYFACWSLLAPTSHNTVPQRYRLLPESRALEFWIDRAIVLPESDVDGRQATISLGCAIENALLVAKAYGFEAKLELSRDAKPLPLAAPGPNPLPVATARFDPPATQGSAEPDLAAVKARKMVRAIFDDRVKLDSALASELSEIVRSVHPGLTLHLIVDAPTKIFLGKFQELADTTVINRAAFARELGAWLLPNDDSRSTVGMRGHEFGLSDASATRMHLGLLGQGPLLPDETAGFAKVGSLGMRSASAVGVICVERDDLEHRIASGRAYQRLAITLVRAGFVTAMHAGITEIEAPNLALRGRLRTRQRPSVVFRIGAPLHPEDAQRPHSARPQLADVLVSAT
jgi:hypothetical protein